MKVVLAFGLHLGEVVTGFGATELAWKMTRVVARHRTLLRLRN